VGCSVDKRQQMAQEQTDFQTSYSIIDWKIKKKAKFIFSFP
jgi:hypothetical protein